MLVRIIPRSYTELEAYMRTMDGRTAGLDPASFFAPGSWQRYADARPAFIESMQAHTKSFALQIKASSAAIEATATLRMFISHFIQGLNNAIARKLIAPADRLFYQLPANSDKLPKLTSESDLVTWAAHIKSGEARRIANGGVPMGFPSAAEVEAVADIFNAARQAHGSAKSDSNDNQRAVKKAFLILRIAIMDLYDELEHIHRHKRVGYIRDVLQGYGMQYRRIKVLLFKQTVVLTAGETIVLKDLGWQKNTDLAFKLTAKKATIYTCRTETGCLPEDALLLMAKKITKTTKGKLPGEGDVLVLTNAGTETVSVEVKGWGG